MMLTSKIINQTIDLFQFDLDKS